MYNDTAKYHHGSTIIHLSVVCPTSNTWGLVGERRGIDVLMEQAGHNTAYHPPTYPLQIPHASLLCTVCDREILVSVEFEFPKTSLTQRKRMCIQFEWIGTIPTKYQPLGEGSDSKSPAFLQHLPQFLYPCVHVCACVSISFSIYFMYTFYKH